MAAMFAGKETMQITINVTRIYYTGTIFYNIEKQATLITFFISRVYSCPRGPNSFLSPVTEYGYSVRGFIFGHINRYQRIFIIIQYYMYSIDIEKKKIILYLILFV